MLYKTYGAKNRYAPWTEWMEKELKCPKCGREKRIKSGLHNKNSDICVKCAVATTRKSERWGKTPENEKPSWDGINKKKPAKESEKMQLNPMKTIQNFTRLNSRVPRLASRDLDLSDFLCNSLVLFSAIAKKFLQLEQIKSPSWSLETTTLSRLMKIVSVSKDTGATRP